ncbi:MAG: hypothetical protein FIB01_08470 [Gemmatimonadetes bacterium]|nr:hypothetical protein [Gemmatimonadota bacterium]
MNIRCPNCQTVFRVDPARIPSDGVRAKCSRCGHAFRIAAPSEPAPRPQPLAATPAAPPAVPLRPATTPSPAGTVAPSSAGRAPRPGGPGPQSPAPAGAPRPHTALPPTPEPSVPTGVPRTPVFGSRDPKARAQRIARALVSDIVAYHKKRVEETLASGRIRSEFRDEIMKSWDEYVAQVGIEMAKGTPFFRDALNDILARGQRVF